VAPSAKQAAKGENKHQPVAAEEAGLLDLKDWKNT
jgi:hypothetical protein